MKIRFIVNGRPVPYTRTTQKQKFNSKQWQRYRDYKAKVQADFLNSLEDRNLRRECAQSMVSNGKPVYTYNRKVWVNIMIYFDTQHHGDPDNIFKGVLDALLVNDKLVAGQFDFKYDRQPRLEIALEVDER